MARGELTPFDKENRQSITDNINYYLRISGMTQVQLSDATGIPRSTLTGYVKGRTTPPLGNIQKLR